MKPVRISMFSRSCASVLALGLIVSTTPAPAQVDSDGGLEEIVVKAQRRDQNLSDVPVGVYRSRQSSMINELVNGYPTEPATYGISFTKNWD